MPSPTNLKPDPLLPEYRWNKTAARYVDSKGRFVSADTIRGQLDKVLDGLSKNADDLVAAFRSGNIPLSELQAAMMQNIKTANLAGAAMERGGWYQMTQSDFGRVGRIVRDDYSWWQKRVAKIMNGEQKLDGTLNVRSKMYMQQGRVTFYRFTDSAQETRGFDEILNVLNAKESCTGNGSCVEQTSFGWMKLDDPRRIYIGRRVCLSNDRCNYEYRNSLNGVTEAR